MVRDQLQADPRAARHILIVGTVVYFLLCIPRYGRRGYPEIDPFWLAVVWLWIPPVFISAAYCRWDRRRAVDLLIYSLATGFVVSWGTVTTRPNFRTSVDAVRDLPVFGPVQVVGVLFAEVLSRAVLSRVRRFLPETPGAYCERWKMCFRRELRGRGHGKAILQRALEQARSLGFRRIQLDTASVLKEAISLYRSFGFRPFQPPHMASRCDCGMGLDLDQPDR